MQLTLGKFCQTLKLEIWDTAGQEKFAALAPLYYHGAHVALLGMPFRVWFLGFGFSA